MSSFRLKTRFGSIHGWEIQYLNLGGRNFWRVTGRTWCRPASAEEVTLWRNLIVAHGSWTRADDAPA